MTTEETAPDPALDVANNASCGHWKDTTLRSLIISPNLDALLEHDERTRCQTAGYFFPQTPELYTQPSPHSSSIGLSPPPRRPRGLKAQGQENQEILAPISPVNLSTSNPYINPAPTLDEVFHIGMSSSKSVSTLMTNNPARDHDGSADCALPWSPIDAQKIIPTQRPSPTAAAQNSDDGREPLTEQPVSALSKTPNRGQLVEQISNTKKSGQSAAFSTNNLPPALNMPQTDREQSEGGRVGVPWRRPLISHGRPSSISSFDSASSSSTTRPTSTVENEPRISISSTIYPASSTQSHSHSLYNEPISTNYRGSFMELYSPPSQAALPEYNLGGSSPVTDGSHEPCSPIRFSGSPISEIIPNSFAGQLRSSKPPIPTTPKPKFSRVTTRSHQPYPMPSTPPPIQLNLPPTTNFLDMDERADLVRKSRKLARVFGQTPGADAMAQQDSGRSPNNIFLQTRSRGVVSNPTGGQGPRRSIKEPFGVAGPRRHSMPLTPDDMSFLSIKSSSFDSYPSPSNSKLQDEMDLQGTSSSDAVPRDAPSQIRSSPPTSFIDLSDDGAGATKAFSTLPAIPTLPSLENMSLEELADSERKRKRERLAKLHRFLGSRVPANLVFGIDDIEASLPPPTSSMGSSSESDDTSIRKIWLKRRSSSSAVLATPACNDGLERAKAELDDREKAINVRRAQKMEKVCPLCAL